MSLACGLPASAAGPSSETVSHAYVQTGVHSGTYGNIWWNATCVPYEVGGPGMGAACFTFEELAGRAVVDIEVTDSIAEHVAAHYIVTTNGEDSRQQYFCDSVDAVPVPVGGPSNGTALLVVPVAVVEGAGPCGGTGVPTTGEVAVTLH